MYKWHELFVSCSLLLTWRDVQHLLVKTSRPVHLKADDWKTNAAGHKGIIFSTFNANLVHLFFPYFKLWICFENGKQVWVHQWFEGCKRLTNTRRVLSQSATCMVLAWWTQRPWCWRQRSGGLFLLSTPAVRCLNAKPGEKILGHVQKIGILWIQESNLEWEWSKII